MYGMVNQAIKDMVTSQFGEEKWIAICKEAKSGTLDFVSMQYYPDEITYSLVGAASGLLKISAETILSEFGKHWILYTAKEGYGPLMSLFGNDFKTCLINLNNLHTRMGMTMPHLSAPRFVFKEVAKNIFEIQYLSSRVGLSPMVQGLLEGLAIRYEVNAKVEFLNDVYGEGIKTFKITLVE